MPQLPNIKLKQHVIPTIIIMFVLSTFISRKLQHKKTSIEDIETFLSDSLFSIALQNTPLILL